MIENYFIEILREIYIPTFQLYTVLKDLGTAAPSQLLEISIGGIIKRIAITEQARSTPVLDQRCDFQIAESQIDAICEQLGDNSRARLFNFTNLIRIFMAVNIECRQIVSFAGVVFDKSKCFAAFIAVLETKLIQFKTTRDARNFLDDATADMIYKSEVTSTAHMRDLDRLLPKLVQLRDKNSNSQTNELFIAYEIAMFLREYLGDDLISAFVGENKIVAMRLICYVSRYDCELCGDTVAHNIAANLACLPAKLSEYSFQ
ncbi:MAG: hypothetical protein M0R33_15330 [Methylomonas sp.]|jgi:hypothetical protein|uniref:hypothetical protein n=1 Tax=Methylomonas sp. TaxID=418 RepID=UPI0025CD6920|nr:hypothetical protein [Methylomonas sp.]MCK9607814.1 hypothetical protein [Methylomonas sp.]